MASRPVVGGSAAPVYVVNSDTSEALPVQNDTEQHKAYSVVVSGEIAGSAAAAQLPSVPCRYARFRAEISNAGNVYLGGPGVTKPDGATDAVTGLELSPGDDTGWIPLDNINRLYRICDNAGDDLTYMALVG